MASRLALIVSLLLALPSGLARAQDKAAAEAAFREARRLMSEKRYDAACPKLETSQRLDPATGTLLNLADCYEKQGRTASAWAAFLEVVQRDGGSARGREARRRAAALEPRLVRLRIDVADAPADLQVTRDGLPAAALVGDAIPIDPGRHEVVAVAAGRRFATEVQTDKEGETVRVAVPPFWVVDPERSRPRPAPPLAPPLVPPLAVASDEMRGGGQRTAGLVTGAVGLVAVAAGLGFGLKARSAWNDSRDGCDDANVCDDAAYAQVEDAQRAATISTVLVGAGAAAVVAGGILWFTAPRAHRKVAVVPAVGPGMVGIVLDGRL